MLVEFFHNFAAHLPIAAGTTVEPGMAIAVDSSGYAVPIGTGGTATTDPVVGLAADRSRSITSSTSGPEWTNRVSDYGNETAASGKLTVYHGGGEFYVDVDDGTLLDAAGSTIAGILVSSSVTTPGTVLYAASGGKLDDGVTGSPVAVIVEDSAELETGIPGEYRPANAFLADDSNPRNWVKIKLLV